MKITITLLLFMFLNLSYCQEYIYDCDMINSFVVDPDFEKIFNNNPNTEASLGAIGKSKSPIYVVFITKDKFYYVTEPVKLNIDRSIEKNGCINVKIYPLESTPWIAAHKERKRKRYTDAFKNIVLYQCMDCATNGKFSNFLYDNDGAVGFP